VQACYIHVLYCPVLLYVQASYVIVTCYQYCVLKVLLKTSNMHINPPQYRANFPLHDRKLEIWTSFPVTVLRSFHY
jgi:hypothetical protein